MGKIIIFTDLDGTLLDPESYSFAAAVPALDLVRKRDIPIVLCSSKTRPEIEFYRKTMEIKDPFISENGGSVFVPQGYFPFDIPGIEKEGYKAVELGKRYGEIREAFSRIRERLGVRAVGFGDMDDKDVAVLTGLSLAEAHLARQREFDEPFMFENGDESAAEFMKAVEEEGFQWTKGRFYHILGGSDKGKAVRILKDLYSKAYGGIETIGLGDGINDEPFLREVDYPVLVQKRDGTHEAGVDAAGLIRAEGIGPEGWKNAVLRLLKEHGA